jgi:hypothetical protein
MFASGHRARHQYQSEAALCVPRAYAAARRDIAAITHSRLGVMEGISDGGILGKHARFIIRAARWLMAWRQYRDTALPRPRTCCARIASAACVAYITTTYRPLYIAVSRTIRGREEQKETNAFSRIIAHLALLAAHMYSP